MSECWICMAAGGSQLVRPCECPRHVHAKCLARWQLQKAGQAEETRCRFCMSTLPDWRAHLGAAGSETDNAPVMSVEYQGKAVFIKLRGHADQASLDRIVKKLFDIPEENDLAMTFECFVPESEEKVELSGPTALSAAMHCAAATAARRSALGA